jgi:peptidoglycan hydrolase CwlO-like protein
MPTLVHIRRLACAALVAALCAAPVASAILRPAPAAAAGTFTIRRVPAKVSLAQLQRQASAVRRQMARLQAEMASISRTYKAARQRFATTGLQLGETRLQLGRSSTQLDTQRAIVAARAVAMYKSSDYSLVDVLVGSGSLTEVQSGVQLYDRVATQDRDAERDLQRLARDVNALEHGLERQRAQADAAKMVIEEQRSEMADRIAQRSALLKDLTSRIDDLLSAGLPHDIGPVNGSYAPLSWAKALLEKLSMPVTSQNVAAVTAWELAEGGHWHNSAHYNPLNTTQPMPGATSMNSVGVKAYSSWAQGFAATIITLHNGYYGGILAALRNGDDAQAVATAVGASPWGTNSFDVDGLVGH